MLHHPASFNSGIREQDNAEAARLNISVAQLKRNRKAAQGLEESKRPRKRKKKSDTTTPPPTKHSAHTPPQPPTPPPADVPYPSPTEGMVPPPTNQPSTPPPANVPSPSPAEDILPPPFSNIQKDFIKGVIGIQCSNWATTVTWTSSPQQFETVLPHVAMPGDDTANILKGVSIALCVPYVLF